MVSTKAKAALAVLAAVAGVGVAAAYATQKMPPPATGITALTLSVDKTSGVTPLTVHFSGAATDASGTGVGRATLYFFVNGVLQQPAIIADDVGNFAFGFVFTQAGSYSCYVSDNGAGK